MQAEQKPRFCDLLEERVITLQQLIALPEETGPRVENDDSWLDEAVDRALDAIRLSRELP